MRLPSTFPCIPTLIDNAVLLRGPLDQDAPAMVRAYAQPQVRRFLYKVANPYTLDDALRYVREKVPAGWRANDRVVFTAADLATNRCFGMVSLAELSVEHSRAELRIWIDPESRSIRRATAAISALCGFGFHELGLMRIAACIPVFDRAAALVIAYAGFRREGVARSYYRSESEGAQHDAVIASLLPEDLSPSKDPEMPATAGAS
jgi:RimJ/RimL family protein N-acetyltransferase